MKILYGLLAFWLVLKAVDQLLKFFRILFTDGEALDTFTIFNAVLGLTIMIYVLVILYKTYIKQETTDQELDN